MQSGPLIIAGYDCPATNDKRHQFEATCDGERWALWCRLCGLDLMLEPLLQLGFRLERDYALFEELAPPDVPRTDFVKWCFDAWEREVGKA